MRRAAQVLKSGVVFLLVLFTISGMGSYGFAAGWKQMEKSKQADLNGIWGSSGSDVFAVGEFYDGVILHYNGSSWSSMTKKEDKINLLQGVWGSSGRDVFAVGDNGTILHYDGSTWSPMTSGVTSDNDLRGVWGSSGSDVFAVGSNGTILHYDGTTWTALDSGTTEGFLGVWGSSGSDVFAVGGTILHYNGSIWSPMTSGTTELLRGVWGSSPTDVYAVGSYGTILHYNGSDWSDMNNGTSTFLNCVWGSSPTDVYAVGGFYDGTIIHYNGSIWSTVYSGTESGFSLNGVWGSSGNNVFAVGFDEWGGLILHYDGSTWSFMVGGGGGCPATMILRQDNTELNKLRAFRNEVLIKSDAGKQYTARYYKHARELAGIFSHDLALSGKANSLIKKIMPVMGSLLVKREAAIGEGTVQDAIELIDDLTAHAGPALQQDLRQLKQDIQSGIIFNTFKVNVHK